MLFITYYLHSTVSASQNSQMIWHTSCLHSMAFKITRTIWIK